MKQYLIAFLVGVALVACMLVTFQIGRANGYNRGYADGAGSVPAKSDTVWRTDTHFVDRPVEKWREVERLVYVPVNDTTLIHVHDTTYIALEREIKGYSGDNYEAQVSGIQPELDWIKVFPRTAYITETKVVKKKWSLGLAAGPGVFWNGGNEIKPGVGAVLGVQYNF